MRLKSILGATVLALVSLAPAQASIIPLLDSGQPVSLGGGSFQYNYTATIDALQDMATGNFLTLYDIAGFTDAVRVNGVLAGVGGVVAGQGFTVSTQTFGVNPTTPPINPADGALTNLTITRTGAALPGQQSFTFSFTSTQGVASLTAGLYAAQGTLKNGVGQSNQGFYAGPAAVPEPSTTVMLGVAGILGLGFRRMRRNRTAV